MKYEININIIKLEMLKRGYYVAHVANKSRLCPEEDTDMRPRFCEFLKTEFGLNEKCFPVGMSCGGLIAIKFAAKYPELVSCLYIDAPVLNYMSCPCGFGIGDACCEDFPEIFDSLGLKNVSELICYTEMPMHKLPALVENRIPAVLVAGGADKTVPYEENGILLERAYKAKGIDLEIYIKPDCGHHPHGLDDPKPIVDFIISHS